MRTVMVSAITVAALLSAATSFAQQPPSGPSHEHSPSTQPPPATPGGAQPGGPGGAHGRTQGGAMGGMHERMHGGTMPCHHMMGGSDPKTTSQMLQMRGEMMKAMGEIMLKYGKAMETPPKP